MLFKIFKYLLFIGSIIYVVYMIGKQQQPINFQSLFSTLQQPNNYLLLLFVVALAPLNVLFESFKWKIFTTPIQPLPFKKNVQSVMAGMYVGLLTPNRIGEFGGRLIFFSKQHRISISIASILCSFTLLSIIVITGLFSLFLLSIVYKIEQLKSLQPLLEYSSIALLFLAVGILISRKKIIRWLKSKHWAMYFQFLKNLSRGQLLTIAIVSILQHLLFTSQFVLLLVVFAAPTSIILIYLITWLMFFLQAIIPSVTLAEIGVRGAISIFLFQSVIQGVQEVLISSFLLWMINVILPALIGGVLVSFITHNNNVANPAE